MFKYLEQNNKPRTLPSQFSGGFVVGGAGGAIFAYLLLTNLSSILQNV